MKQNDKELTAYCGLYCGDCIRYLSRAADLARELLGELQETEFSRYAELKSSPQKQPDTAEQLAHFGECCEVLEAIVALQCNRPCRVGGGCPSFTCNILACCRARGLEGCWQCDAFEGCEKLEILNTMHGDSPRQNLRKIKELGPERWVEHRCKSYVWQ